MNNGVNERISQLRVHLRLSQEEFAVKTGMTQAGVWRIEKGETKPRRTTIGAIASAFGASAEWLSTGAGEMFSPLTNEPPPSPTTISWRDEAFFEVKKQNEELLRQLHWYQNLVSKLVGSPDFQPVSNLAGALSLADSPITDMRAAA